MIKRNFQNWSLQSFVFLSFLLLSGIQVLAQENETGQNPRTGNINYPNPSSIISKYTYDPITNRYIYSEKIEDVNTTYPIVLTPDEFQKLLVEEQNKNYFKDKFDATKSREDDGKDEERRNLLPVFYVDNSFFKSIFGGGEIEIIPQGSVEVGLGILFNKQDNPSLSPRNRSSFTFDFDQNINLSLNGHVGERLTISANYDTQSTFDFQNQIKLEYTPDEDDIVRKIELGNVSMPMSNSLISGSQSLFGLKTEFQFGKTRITGVYSEQNSERQVTTIEGGGAVQEFEKFALDYDENRHFFLSHYFREHYDEALEHYPYINSNIEITRVQVWVTNRSNSPDHISNARNIVGIQDIGESNPAHMGVFLDSDGNPINPPEFTGFVNVQPGAYPDNANNDFNPLGINGPQQSVLTPAIRDVSTVGQGFGALSPLLNEGIDYAKLESARELSPGEYTIHPKLGYISLRTRIRNDEMLAVAFEYTVNGQVHQVGEFGSDGVDASAPMPGGNQDGIVQNQSLVVKLLKSPITSVNEPVWDLMMKNIYSLDANGLTQEDFDFNILYTDPQPLNYISPAGDGSVPLSDEVADVPLLRVFNLDNLNFNQDPVTGGDGFFDFVPGITIDPEDGMVIFTTVEPFGEHLFEKLQEPGGPQADYEDPSTYNANQDKYVFRSLYRSTKTQADQDESDKNKFQLIGSYRSSGEDGIPIGSFNVPRGSVKVTAGGRELQEGVDYTVDYELGRVKIINEALKASDTPIQVSTENNALFGQKTKRFAGLQIDHEVNENLMVGATLLNMSEKPQTHKSNYGYEPINNTMYGFNFNYSSEVPFFTRLVNKLPNIDTDVPSNLSVRGEFAYLQPGTPTGDNFGGESTSYIDDFESSQTGISVLAPQSWFLSSVPLGFGGEKANDDLSSGYKRAKLNWYSIDPIFYSSQRPSEVTDNSLSKYSSRRIFKDEIFPDTDILEGESRAIYSLDLAYYPAERGMYNYNPAAAGSNILPNPDQNFGGIMRGIDNSDFEQTNVQYIEFWVMDPYIYDENAGLNRGKLVFNLGSISEDVLKDGRKQYENGLPKDGSTTGTIETAFGRVPSSQSLVYAFDTEGIERANQDIGLDGLGNDQEKIKFPAFASDDDPSRDDYEYYLKASGDNIVSRYRWYNGLEGNSPSSMGQNDRGNTTLPSTEDVNGDNTMNTIDSYFEYEVPLYEGMSVDNNTSNIAGVDQDYITDVKEVNVTLQNGQQQAVRWIQFKVPLSTDSKYSKGGISDMRSIRFMRMFLTEFNEDVVLRFGSLDLVRGDYRKYEQALEPGGSDPKTTPGTTFTSSSVSEEKNSDYVSPPGVKREELINNNQRIREDEQSLSLKIKRLAPNDMRAVYKNFQVDMRQFKNLKMFLHAASLPAPSPALENGDLSALIRIGSDIKNNFYQIEIPLKVSPEGSRSEYDVWPKDNELDLPLSLLQDIKATIIGDQSYTMTDLNYFDSEGNPVSANAVLDGMKLAMKGNPSFGDVRVIMLGLKNTGTTDVSGEVWLNEFRMADMKNDGGWAANLNLDTNFADFMSISANGHKSTIGFGSIEQGPNARSREDVKGYDVVTNVNAGQLLPDRWGLNLPFSYSRGEELITPEYDPEFKDIELSTLLKNAADAAAKDELRKRAEEYTKRQSFSIIGLSKRRTTDKTPLPIDIENFSFSGTYNQIDHRDFKIEEGLGQNVNVGATYDYGFMPWNLEPFKGMEFMQKSRYWAPIRDFNFDPLPNSISATGNILRQYNEQKFRQINLPEGSLGLPKLYQRDYRFNWGFTINDKLTESLDVVLNMSNNRIIRNYLDDDGVQDNTIGVWDDFFDMGVPNQHNQSLQVNYELPFDKFPFLRFIRAQYSYTGNFQWQKGSEILRTLPDTPDLGNTVQNSRTHQINGTLTMSRLYDYLGLKKKTRAAQRQQSRQNALGFSRVSQKSGGGQQEVQTESTELSFGEHLLNVGIDLVTAVKRVNINYDETRGTFLPGYLQEVGFIGTLKPSTAFTFGSQSDIREMAARKGWLTLYQDFNQQYATNTIKNLNIKADVSFVKDLTIDLSADRTYADNYMENYRVDPDGGQYRSLTPRSFGNFTVSTIMIGTAFKSSDENYSQAFEDFRNNRMEIARRLAERAGMDLSDPNNIGPDGYPIGFGKSSQQVLLPAFLSAYTGENASSVSLGAFRNTPLPNWDLKYTGLMRLKFFRDHFNRFSVQHGYSAGYTINQFETNLSYDRDNPFGANNKDQNGNFRSKDLISNINLAEQFSPLVKLDFEMKNSVSILAQVDKDRALSLSFNNNLLTEIQGNEYRLGLGYRIKDLKVTTQVEGETRVLTGDLNLKADVSYRNNKTIVRYLDINESQVTTGQDRWEFHFTADYALSRNLTAMFYYDHNFSKYFVSTAFPQTSIRSGFRLRYTFGG